MGEEMSILLDGIGPPSAATSSFDEVAAVALRQLPLPKDRLHVI